MAREWYVSAAGRVEGPVTSRELADRAASGRLLPNDKVSPDRKKWVPAAKVKGLQFPPQAMKGTAVVPSGNTPPSLPATPPLTDVPGYAIEGVLGEGGMGVVYRARQIKLDRTVALKTVGLAVGTDAGILARFEKEAVALAKLQHPNIVAVYDSGRAGERLFFAMELLTGEDLDQRIDRHGKLDELTAWLVARQTAAALAHAAAHGITHRDIKPANLFLVAAPVGSGLPDGVPMVKVTDFGLALTRGGPSDRRLTVTGTMVGTPIYMAPEQFQTSDLDHRADIYSLGASVYHALSGKMPFDHPTIWELMLAKRDSQPRLVPPVSAETIELVAAMMEPKPADRIGTYEELIARIDALACVRGAAPAKVFRRRRPTRWLLIGGAAAVLAAGAVGAVFAFRGDPPQTAPTTADLSRYVAEGFADELYVSNKLTDWQGQGEGWAVEADVNGDPVLTGKGRVRRPFPSVALTNYRVTLGVNLHKASAVDAWIGVPTADTAPRFVVRVTQAGAVLGTKAGDDGPFTPLTAVVPFPSGAEPGEEKYREVRFEKAGGQWRAYFENRLVGAVPDDGVPRRPELRLLIDGGAVRIVSAQLQELREQK